MMNKDFHGKAIAVCLLVSFASFVGVYFSSCSSLPVAPQPTPSTSSSPGPVPTPSGSPVGTLPQPVKGWPEAYTDFIITQVPQTLLSVKKIDFCPNWETMDEMTRRTTWALILKGIALPESGWNRTERYREPGMVDKQGRQVYSDGLLQLSYQDKDNYGSHAPRCQAFDRAGDAGKDPSDWSINNAYYNLGCGLDIMARLIARDGERLGARGALGEYWSTMRLGKCEARTWIRKNSACGAQPGGC